MIELIRIRGWRLRLTIAEDDEKGDEDEEEETEVLWLVVEM